MEEQQLTDAEVEKHAEGINYLLNMAKNEPEEYKKMYARLPPGAKLFLGDFLQDKLTQLREKQADPGPITTVFVHGRKGVDAITLLENKHGQKPTKQSLCTIFNQLEREGYQFVACGGAHKKDESELLFTWKKQKPSCSSP